MNHKITMELIAKELGINRSTVSKALRNKDDLSKELKEKVMAKAISLGYSKSVSYNICVISALRYWGSEDSYYAQLYALLHKSLKAQNHLCSIHLIDNEEESNSSSAPISNSPIDGFIIIGHLNFSYIEQIQSLNKPLILLDTYSNQLEVDSISPEDYYNAYKVTDLVIALGHNRIGYCGNISMTSGMQDRFLGYRKALIENNLIFETSWLIEDRNPDGSDQDIKLPSILPTAFVCLCDKTAYRLINILSQNELSVPKDVSIVSFDDTLYSTLQHPNITNISTDKETLVNKTIEILNIKIKNPKAKYGKIFIQGSIIKRESHGFVFIK